MAINTTYKHPWQNGPSEMIIFSIDLLRRGINSKHLSSVPKEIYYGPPVENTFDFNNLLAFLFTDIAIESMFKVYLGLPDEVIKAKGVEYKERCKASKGYFHQVVSCVRKCAGSKIDGINLSHVQHYHNIRNKLYHEGDSITIPFQTALDYTDIAVKLLNILLGVDLKDVYSQLRSDDLDLDIKDYDDHSTSRNIPQILYKELELCIESLLPKLLYPSNIKKLDSCSKLEPLEAMWIVCDLIENVFSVDYNDCLSDRDIDTVNKRLKETSGTDINDYPTKKEVVIRVMSGFPDRGYPSIKNLPVKDYKLNSLSFDDFVRIHYEIGEVVASGLYYLFLKIVCEIIDHEVAIGTYNYNNQEKKKLTHIVNQYYHPSVLLILQTKEEFNEDNDYLYEVIKDWRCFKLSSA